MYSCPLQIIRSTPYNLQFVVKAPENKHYLMLTITILHRRDGDVPESLFQLTSQQKPWLVCPATRQKMQDKTELNVKICSGGYYLASSDKIYCFNCAEIRRPGHSFICWHSTYSYKSSRFVERVELKSAAKKFYKLFSVFGCCWRWY